jgi:hypothetical protein
MSSAQHSQLGHVTPRRPRPLSEKKLAFPGGIAVLLMMGDLADLVG